VYKIKRNDTVIVRTGRDKGKKGEVKKIYASSGRALVEKVNLVKKHVRPSQQSPGGVMEREAPIRISNLQLVCPKCDKAIRVKFDSLEDGEKVRVCRKCGEMIL